MEETQDGTDSTWKSLGTTIAIHSSVSEKCYRTSPKLEATHPDIEHVAGVTLGNTEGNFQDCKAKGAPAAMRGCNGIYQCHRFPDRPKAM